jgi:hypothetical protein
VSFKCKNYFEFCELVKQSLDDYQARLESPKKINLTWEEPDATGITESITIGLKKREPGAFAQGAPFEGTVKHLKPLLRESIKDPDAPGYRKAILGKWHDNLIQFTCWAQTNKEAIKLAFWFEEFMNKYEWFYITSGVRRVIFWGQEEDLFLDNQGKKYYGRPLLYFVQTEELTYLSEKEMESICVNLAVRQD